MKLTRANHVGDVSRDLFDFIVEVVEDLVIFCSFIIEVFGKITALLLLEPSISVRNISNCELSAD